MRHLIDEIYKYVVPRRQIIASPWLPFWSVGYYRLKTCYMFPSLALRLVGLAWRLMCWCQDRLTSSICNKHRNRRPVNEILLQEAFKHTNKTIQEFENWWLRSSANFHRLAFRVTLLFATTTILHILIFSTSLLATKNILHILTFSLPNFTKSETVGNWTNLFFFKQKIW